MPVLTDGAGVSAVPVTRHADNRQVEAIARVLRWRHILESSERSTI
jgi:hypothetical protein